MKWGIIGLGYMAKKFATSFPKLNDTEILGIASRSIIKLKKFGDKFGIKKDYRFKNYEDILKCKEIDNIYISTINNSHFELILNAIDHKKNILCEKPITTNHKDALIIFEKLKKKNIFFMEAIPYRAHPITNFLIKTINEKVVGEIVSIESFVGFAKKTKSLNHRLFNLKLGGGAILDIGCYPVSFSNLIANINNKQKNLIPKIASVSGNVFKTGVDNEAYAILEYENKIFSEIGVSITKEMENKTIINGSQGKITIDNPWSPEEKSYIEIDTDKRYYKLFINSNLSLLTNQINVVNKLIKNGKTEANYPCMTWKNSLDNALILNKWKDLLTNQYEN